MYKNLSSGSMTLINAMVEAVYGESVEEIKVKAKEDAKADVERELKQMDEQRAKSIILLYTRVDMTIDEIADHLALKKDVVTQILLQNKITIK